MKVTLPVLYRSTTFRITLLVFAAANAWSWVRFRFFPPCCDELASHGLPFPVHIPDNVTGAADYYLFGFLLDVTAAVTVAVLLTWIAEGLRAGPESGPDERAAGIKAGEATGESEEQVGERAE